MSPKLTEAPLGDITEIDRSALALTILPFTLAARFSESKSASHSTSVQGAEAAARVGLVDRLVDRRGVTAGDAG